jgi:hypothetical protein
MLCLKCPIDRQKPYVPFWQSPFPQLHFCIGTKMKCTDEEPWNMNYEGKRVKVKGNVNSGGNFF